MLPVFSIFKIKSLNFLLAFFYFLRYTYSRSAGVMELADVVDSKSTGSDTVPVRVRPPAPVESLDAQAAFEAFLFGYGFVLAFIADIHFVIASQTESGMHLAS